MREISSIPIDTLVFDDVVRFCGQQIPEHLRLEYKQAFASKNPGQKIAKEVAAFANTQGGTIIYGVQEAANRRPEDAPKGTNLGSDARARILSSCAHNIFPPVVPEVSDLLANPTDPALAFLVVRVPASDQVHTVEGRRGIYLRVADQSEPVRATIDEIEQMAARRSVAVGLQGERRRAAFEQLDAVLGAASGEPRVWTCIGPHVNTTPLFEVRELRDQAESLSVSSYSLRGRRFPFQGRGSTASVMDGIYSVDKYGKSAALVDVYGNVTSLMAPLRPHRFDDGYLDDDQVADLPKVDGEHVGVNCDILVERLFSLVRAADNLYRLPGFVGLVTMEVNASHVRKTPLVFPRSSWGDIVLGTCPTTDSISFQRTVTASSLGNPGQTLLPVVETLLWSWGYSKDDGPPAALDAGERAHYGFDVCPCGKSQKPRNREHCLQCRSDTA